jgi:hypothetical protein
LVELSLAIEEVSLPLGKEAKNSESSFGVSS